LKKNHNIKNFNKKDLDKKLKKEKEKNVGRDLAGEHASPSADAHRRVEMKADRIG
jgi:hypothetical protein